MKEITRNLDLPREMSSDSDFRDLLFLDIETTGLTAYRSRVYLIGCCREEDGRMLFRQWLTECPEDEPEVLTLAGKFYQDMGEDARIVTFNGEHFDLPFLSRRCGAHGVPDAFLGAAQKGMDLYQRIRPCRRLLNLPNLKQKTAEMFLGIGREDRFSGGDLIRVYHGYESHPNPNAERLLLLHNEEDVLAMPRLMPLLSYAQFLQGRLSVSEVVRLSEEISTQVAAGSTPQAAPAPEETCRTPEIWPAEKAEGEMPRSDSRVRLVASLRTTLRVPVPIPFASGPIRGYLKGDGIQLSIPEYNGTLRFYIPDYRNYYFLPEEGIAIHKSVASFVDRNYREPATPDTAFLQKEGNFLYAPGGLAPYSLRLFSRRRGEEQWLDADALNLDDPHFWTSYLRPVARSLASRGRSAKKSGDDD